MESVLERARGLWAADMVDRGKPRPPCCHSAAPDALVSFSSKGSASRRAPTLHIAALALAGREMRSIANPVLRDERAPGTAVITSCQTNGQTGHMHRAKKEETPRGQSRRRRDRCGGVLAVRERSPRDGTTTDSP